jgi:hypothetical protein
LLGVEGKKSGRDQRERGLGRVSWGGNAHQLGDLRVLSKNTKVSPRHLRVYGIMMMSLVGLVCSFITLRIYLLVLFKIYYLLHEVIEITNCMSTLKINNGNVSFFTHNLLQPQQLIVIQEPTGEKG